MTSWRTVTLADVCDFENGDRGKNYPGKSAILEAGVPFVNAGDLDGGSLRRGTLSYISPDHFRKLSNGKFKKGDILFCLRGTLGKFARVESDISGAIASSLIIIRPKSSIHPDYLNSYLGSNVCKEQIELYRNGAAQPNLAASSLKRFEVPLPTIPEQQRIAKILGTADALRRKRKRTLNLLDGLTQSIFLEMFGDPIENTKHLPIAPLENVVSPTRKITYGILKPGPDQAHGVPYVRVIDIQNSLIDLTGLKRTTPAIASEYKRSTLREGDLLISIRGHVGRMAIAPPECDGANITQDTARLAITAANTEFVKAQLETGSAKHWMTQRTKGAAVKGINLGDLRQFPLILPPRAAQDEFADKIGLVRAMLKKGSQQKNDLDAICASLQSRAFSGQL